MYNSTLNHSTKPKVPEVKLIFFHLIDILIGGGLLGYTIISIGDWQAGISLSILIMFAGLRGASLFEDIRKKRIDNEEKDFDLKVKKGEFIPKNEKK